MLNKILSGISKDYNLIASETKYILFPGKNKKGVFSQTRKTGYWSLKKLWKMLLSESYPEFKQYRRKQIEQAKRSFVTNFQREKNKKRFPNVNDITIGIPSIFLDCPRDIYFKYLLSVLNKANKKQLPKLALIYLSKYINNGGLKEGETYQDFFEGLFYVLGAKNINENIKASIFLRALEELVVKKYDAKFKSEIKLWPHCIKRIKKHTNEGEYDKALKVIKSLNEIIIHKSKNNIHMPMNDYFEMLLLKADIYVKRGDNTNAIKISFRLVQRRLVLLASKSELTEKDIKDITSSSLIFIRALERDRGLMICKYFSDYVINFINNRIQKPLPVTENENMQSLKEIMQLSEKYDWLFKSIGCIYLILTGKKIKIDSFKEVKLVFKQSDSSYDISLHDILEQYIEKIHVKNECFKFGEKFPKLSEFTKLNANPSQRLLYNNEYFARVPEFKHVLVMLRVKGIDFGSFQKACLLELNNILVKWFSNSEDKDKKLNLFPTIVSVNKLLFDKFLQQHKLKKTEKIIKGLLKGLSILLKMYKGDLEDYYLARNKTNSLSIKNEKVLLKLFSNMSLVFSLLTVFHLEYGSHIKALFNLRLAEDFLFGVFNTLLTILRIEGNKQLEDILTLEELAIKKHYEQFLRSPLRHGSTTFIHNKKKKRDNSNPKSFSRNPKLTHSVFNKILEIIMKLQKKSVTNRLLSFEMQIANNFYWETLNNTFFTNKIFLENFLSERHPDYQSVNYRFEIVFNNAILDMVYPKEKSFFDFKFRVSSEPFFNDPQYENFKESEFFKNIIDGEKIKDRFYGNLFVSARKLQYRWLECLLKKRGCEGFTSGDIKGKNGQIIIEKFDPQKFGKSQERFALKNLLNLKSPNIFNSAVEEGSVILVAFSIIQGMDPKYKDTRELTPLGIADRMKNESEEHECIYLMLKAAVDSDSKNEEKIKKIMKLVATYMPEVKKVIDSKKVKKPKNVKTVERKKNTNKEPHTIKQLQKFISDLVKASPNVSIENRGGKHPIKIVVKKPDGGETVIPYPNDPKIGTLQSMISRIREALGLLDLNM